MSCFIIFMNQINLFYKFFIIIKSFMLMKQKFNFLYTEGKPQTLVMLKNPQDMPQLLFAPPSENIFVWVGGTHQSTIKVRDELERDLQQPIYYYASVQQAVTSLKDDKPQLAVLIVVIQQFQSWKRLINLSKVKTIYFYSDCTDYQIYMNPLKQKLFNQSNALINSDESQEENQQIIQQENEAQEWRQNVYTESRELAQKLRSYKGVLAAPLKILPNFVFMDENITVSQSLIRTMHSLLRQEVDQATTSKINKYFQKFLGQMEQIDHNLKNSKYEYDKNLFFEFINKKDSLNCKNIINWYTEETFLYKIVNNLLRSHRHPSEIFYVQPYVKKLFCTLKELYTHQSKQINKWKFKCYRGGKMNEEQFQKMNQNKGKTIQNLGFLSTSLSKVNAERFTSRGNALFEIQVEEQIPGSSEFGFANIQQFSKFFNEQEVLFNPLNTFYIDSVQQGENYYLIKLRYCVFNQIQRQRQLSKQQILWRQIAKLQKQQSIVNLCQGNALTNQYYSLEGAQLYWDQYIKIVSDQLRTQKNEIRALCKFKKAFGIFNRYNYCLLNSKDGFKAGRELGKASAILKSLLADQDSIVERLDENLQRVCFPPFLNNSDQSDQQISQQQLQMLKDLPEYKFFDLATFGNLQFMSKHKYKIADALNLRNMGITEAHLESNYRFAFGKQLRRLDFSRNGLATIPLWVLQDLTGLLELSISQNKIKKLPQQIKLLKNLQKLSIDRNLFEEILKEVFELTELKVFDTSKNFLTALPKEIGKLLKLQQLILSQNRLAELPSQVWMLLQLKVLKARKNNLKMIPAEIKSLTKSQRVDFSSNDLIEVPKQIFSLFQLVSLNLSSNSLATLPQGISNLLKLERLYMSQNQLTSLSEQIGGLVNLKVLSLRNNKLLSLPSETFKLSKLQHLDVSINLLSELSQDFVNLVNLNYLSLGNNLLTKLPKGVASMSSLRFMSINKIMLCQIPNLMQTERLTISSLQYIENIIDFQKKTVQIKFNNHVIPSGIGNLKNLQQLIVTGQMLKQLPTEISQLRKLKSLCLSRNNLTGLSQRIGDLSNLQELDLSSNIMNQLPNSIVKLKRLKILDLHKNKLRYLPTQLFKLVELLQLTISQNELKKLKGKVSNLVNLKVLNLSGNQIKKLPKGICNLKGLLQLDVSKNQLTVFPDSICGLHSLRKLDMLENKINFLPEGICNLRELEYIYLSGSSLGQAQQAKIIEMKNQRGDWLSYLSKKLNQKWNKNKLYLTHISTNHGKERESKCEKQKHWIVFLIFIHLKVSSRHIFPTKIVNQGQCTTGRNNCILQYNLCLFNIIWLAIIWLVLLFTLLQHLRKPELMSKNDL